MTSTPSDELLSRISHSCGQNKVGGDRILNNVYQTVYTMTKDRGYSVTARCEHIDVILEMIAATKPVLVGELEGMQGTICVFFISEDKVGIKQARSLLEAEEYASSKLVIVSVEGPTSFTKKEIGANDDAARVQFFTFSELMTNVSRHRLVPAHRQLNNAEASDVMQKYCISKKSQFPSLLMNDPIRKYYDFGKGNVIEIRRQGIALEEQLYYRVVV